MPFFAHLKGPGEGCDYTIGCNEKFVALPLAANLEEAQAAVLEEYGSCVTGAEPSVSSVIIYECALPIEVDVKAYIRKVADEAAAERRERENAKDRAEYEKLKRKFEK
jgi:hypothetical protein